MRPDGSAAERPVGRDWAVIREWTNVATAVGALLVGIVTFWTTTQISGVEDYFRSEIARRNSELDTLAGQSRRLAALADERTSELARLQTATDQLTASNFSAQGKLMSAQQELSQVGLEVLRAKQTLTNSESRLASITAQSDNQIKLIDRFRRKHFYERASLRVLYIGLFNEGGDETNGLNGESVYQLVTNLPLGEIETELADYLPEFRKNAGNTCRWLRTYNPEVPKQTPYPKGPRMPGAPSEDGKSMRMTSREYEQWTAATEDWNRRWSEVSAANRAASEKAGKIRSYLQDAAASCICRALVTAANPASEICPGRENPPERPEIAAR